MLREMVTDKASLESYWDEVANGISSDYSIKDNWGKRRGLLKELLKYDIERCNILEIGAGAAVTAKILSMCYGLRVSYKGTDISDRFIRVAKRNGMEVTKAYANCLPYEDNFFDVLFAFDVLEHIRPEEKMPVYREIERVMKDKCIIFINNPHKLNPCYHDASVEHGFNHNDLAAMCQVMGLDIYEVTTYAISQKYRYQFIALTRGIYEHS